MTSPILTLFNSPDFWRGALTSRLPSRINEIGEGNIGRIQTLLDVAESGSNPIRTPEFEAWLTYSPEDLERVVNGAVCRTPRRSA